MSELKNKTIITVATTGAWPTKANNPNVPMTPEEISEDVYACWKAGAAIAHLHMRDDEGHGTMDKEKFRKIDMDSFGILVSMIMGCVMESIGWYNRHMESEENIKKIFREKLEILQHGICKQ